LHHVYLRVNPDILKSRSAILSGPRGFLACAIELLKPENARFSIIWFWFSGQKHKDQATPALAIKTGTVWIIGKKVVAAMLPA
jgi:hypothetical protein